MPTRPLPVEDLNHILNSARLSFLTLRNANLFITGGTGFFGHWLLESLLHANRELSINLRATVLTRNAAAFRAKSPHITNDPAITLLEGDILTFAFPPQRPTHTHILHAATDSGGQQAFRAPEELYNDILAGTRRVLGFAHYTGARRLLYTSTGAVYGRSTTLLHTPETYLETDTPNLPPHSYEAAKRAAELLILEHTTPGPLEPQRDFPTEAILARCFAFVGPHLPLDAHFAIGNFIAAALAHQPIHIRGDGTPRRSWLYMSDLAIWLWTLLTRGAPGRAYNVGSDDGMTIAEAAGLVVHTLAEPAERERMLMPDNNMSFRPDGKGAFSSLSRPTQERALAPDLKKIQIDHTPNLTAPLNSYVPSIARARDELGLRVNIPLDEALRRTAAWHQIKSPHELQ